MERIGKIICYISAGLIGLGIGLMCTGLVILLKA
jgi:hypothetical protein